MYSGTSGILLGEESIVIPMKIASINEEEEK